MEKKSRWENFWDDSQKAGKIMQDMEDLKKVVAEIEDIEKKILDFQELVKLTENQADRKEIENEIEKLEKIINELEFRTLFSEEYDRNDAIVSIYAGAGGIDAQDWSSMLLKMYLRWAEKNNFSAKILNETKGTEAGIKNATLEIKGTYAYGYLRSEAGVHRLVRLSPFNADNLRQTSFSLIDVMPVIEKLEEVKIDMQTIRVDVFHSSGAGGQSVNTSDSAVRMTHLPTGVQATCQNERSQLRNKEQALKILKAKLHKKYLEKRKAKEKELRGETISAEWGSQIRSYVLHPYKKVKDHRTKYETTQVEEVLDGKLNEFMESYLKYSKK